MKRDDLLSLSQACNELSISPATGRNWVRLGKLAPTAAQGNSLLFDAAYIKAVKKRLQSGKNAALKSRRNKTYISGNAIYKSYIDSSSPNMETVQALLAQIAKQRPPLAKAQILWLVADCAAQLLWQGWDLCHYLTDKAPAPETAPLLDALIGDSARALEFISANKDLFMAHYHYVPGEDTLGFLYLSLIGLGQRKANGAYYTPTEVAKRLIQALPVAPLECRDKTFLDPCCGTGSFLMQFPQSMGIEHLFASDIDNDCIKVARLNTALHFHTSDIPLIRSHIVCRDFLLDFNPFKADYIIGNPPWGSAFPKPQMNAIADQFSCAHSGTLEAYDLFVERALSLLPPGGIFSFVLPEAILTVRSHRRVRQLLLEQCRIRRVDYLGNAFHQVQCPCILLQCEKTDRHEEAGACTGAEITCTQKQFIIQKERTLCADSLSFYADDSEYALLQKITHMPHAVTMHGQADFALGIVTGNNRETLLDAPTADTEPILRGSDIHPYFIKQPKKFLKFQPQKFQQAAKEHLYRAPQKLVYRFIGGKLVFAYDDKQRLTLNSCNILIPRIPCLHIKYVMAVLNSPITQFFIDKQYHSLKILRSHIEAIPIPLAGEKEQTAITLLVDELLTALQKGHTLIELPACRLINEQIARLYGLTQEESQLIQQTVRF